MSVAVASTASPHQLPLHKPPSENPPRASPTKGYRPPTAAAERVFAEGSRSSPQKSRDEPRGAYRKQSIKTITEANGDVDAFIQEVDSKRRQLDEQIHRYIKQKEREFKLFERDARIKYRAAGSARTEARRLQDASAGHGPANPGPPTSTSRTGEDGSRRGAAAAARSQPRLADNGLNDPEVTRERETDLLGLFTPTYLSLLANKSGHDRPPSAPAVLASESRADPSPLLTDRTEKKLHRANSDPSEDKKAIEATRRKLEHRTSSSGSEGKNLVSVLKSPAAGQRGPKRKRVSIVVGSDIVAPSDNIDAAVSPDDDAFDHGAPEHVEQVDFAGPAGGAADTSDSDARPSPRTRNTRTMKTHASPEAGPLLMVNHSPPLSRNVSGISSAFASQRNSSTPVPTQNLTPTPTPNPELNVFDFSDQDLELEDRSDHQASDVDEDDVSPVSTPAPPEDIPGRVKTQASGLTADFSRRAEAPFRPAPVLRTSSSSSSQQPVSPGFSRPSVTSDQFFPVDMAPETTPEIEKNELYGSFSASLSLKAGSLSESFMERNAEQLRRSGRRRTGLESQNND